MQKNQKQYGVLLIIGDVVNARFRIKSDAWQSVEDVLRKYNISHSPPTSSYYKGNYYKTLEFSSSWNNFYRVRLVINQTQQMRLLQIASQLRARIDY